MRKIRALFEVPISTISEFLLLTSVAGFVAAFIEQTAIEVWVGAFSCIALVICIGLRVFLALLAIMHE